MARYFAWSLVSSLALVACVQVLGLEEAKLDHGQHSGPAVPGIDGSECEANPSAECSLCLADNDCVGVVESCAQDTSCWVKLDVWAECLGSACDADVEECSMAIRDAELRNCATLCGEDCRSSKLIPECRVLCSCMADTCGGVFEDCVESCSSLPPEVARCRRAHCLSADLAAELDDPVDREEQRERHCGHADGTDTTVCLTNVELPPVMRRVCVAGQETGWGCNSPDDCCSGACDDGVCE